MTTETCSICSAELLEWHPASRADGRVEGTCPEHGLVVAADPDEDPGPDEPGPWERGDHTP